MIFPSIDGFLTTYSRDQTAKMWNAATGECLQTFALKNFDLKTLLFSCGKILFVSETNIFGAIDYSKPVAVTTSPRTVAYIPTRRM